MRKVILALAITASCATSAMAASFDDPEWPCIQRKVPEISTAQMWAGPEITDEIVALGKTPAIADVASRLALRRVDIADAEQLIADFAADSGSERNDMLTALFARTFKLIADERKTIMSGIGRYAKKQTALSDLIETRRDEIIVLNAVEPPNYDKIEELEDFLAWDERIFRERGQSLTYVCETPTILEQRIFAISRAIQSHLEP